MGQQRTVAEFCDCLVLSVTQVRYFIFLRQLNDSASKQKQLSGNKGTLLTRGMPQIKSSA